MNRSFPAPDYRFPNDPVEEGESFDFKRYLSLIVSNWYWFAIALFISFGIAYAKNRYSERIYTVSASLLIKDDQSRKGGADITTIFPGSSAFNTEQNLKNEIGILKSFSLNLRILDELKDFHVVYVSVGRRGIAETRLYKESPFTVEYDSLNEQTIGFPVYIKILSEETFELSLNSNTDIVRTLNFGETFKEPGFNFIIQKNPETFEFDPKASNRYYFYFLSPINLANQYRSKLSVSPIEEDANLVTLSTSGFVPKQEADYINTLMEMYIMQGLELKNITAEKTIEFIDKQIGLISDSLSLVENRLEDFRLANKFFDISQEGNFIQSRLDKVETEKSTLLLQIKYYQYLKDYIDFKNETGDIVSPGTLGIVNTSLERYISELASLQQQKNKIKVNIYDGQPAVNFFDKEISDIKALISENIKSNIDNLSNAIEDANDRIAEVEIDLSKLPGTERELISIQRKFSLNNTVYNYLLEKKAEAGIARASNVSENRVIDPAEPFNAAMISPKSKRNYTIALFLGFLLPVVLIILIDYLNNKVIDKKDIEKGTRAPVIGFISHNNIPTEIPVSQKPGSSLSESFRSLRTNLKYLMKEGQNQVISISSTISSEGKTFISTNLAAIIASNNKKVLLVELDLRKPRIHKIFKIEATTGISNYLIGKENFENILLKTEIENLWYAPSGPIPPNPAELIDSESMREFISNAKKQFDFIIIDTPPVALVTDAMLMSSVTDLYLFVVRQRYSSKNTLELIEELYKNENIKKLGIVINDISLTGYYGYGLRYGYTAGYGYSYGYNYYGYGMYNKYGYSNKSNGYYKEEDI